MSLIAEASMTLRERKKRQTMKSILAAAREMLSENEYDSITTKEVAARAGIGEATLFRYVVNKKNLFLLIYEEFFNDVLQACLDEDAKDTTEHGTAQYYIDRITTMYTSLAGLYKRDPDSGYVYVRDSFSPEDFGQRGLEQGDRWHALVERVIHRGQDAGVLRPSPPRLIAQNIHAIYVHEVLATHARGRDPRTIEQRLATRISALAGTLTT
ncbi:TetR/AcrR family transcriptional regulator [Arthrobacter sp. CDRTa11]|uniref:TetR/AcrR family transcriptional regulator n=1 Tax=Arthrobacter sp. CDRTa11 TaxID=2651199 RepID=UPI002265EBA8|nr:TetR/AcrR family transcriptional regulator [Arthrobacter sp. CDRTa11]UZX02932.1 TetR/AcrR family transcriptional regulator [Arthrobacter sp. CDRTa11]